MRPPGPQMQDGPHDRGPGRGAGPHRMLLRGLDLSEAQDDKVFAILHAQEPQRRAQERLLHKSQDELHVLGRSAQFDEAKAGALAQTIGKAAAALELLQARTDAQLRALLTPEQLQRLASGPGRRPG